LSRSAIASDADYPRLKSHVIESSGLAYYRDKDEELAHHIAQRLEVIGLESCAAYLDALHGNERGEAELDALIAQLTIGETYFFRHAEQFDALRRTVVPDILERNQGSRRLRVWSAGCATGAEAYSIAALLEEFNARTAGWDVRILGTDINRRFLAKANEGCFENWAFRGVDETFKQRYFRPQGKSWLISDALKSKVTFQYHNLIKHTLPSLTNNLFGLDLIICRNVMIYFDPAAITAVVGRLRESLADGGWLVVGHAESTPDLFRNFRMVCEHGAAVYQKPLPQGPAAQTAGPQVFCFPPAPAGGDPRPETAGAPPATQVEPKEQPRAESASAALPKPDLESVRRLADRGEWQLAAGECRKLLESNGLDPLTHFYNALILDQTGAASPARQELQRAIYLDRQFVLAHYHLGLLQQKEKQTAQAARSFENVLELLARRDDQQAFAEADGITVAELRELTRAHLEVLGARG